MSSRSRWAIVLVSAASMVALACVPGSAFAQGRITGGTKVDRPTFDARWSGIVSLRSGFDGDRALPADLRGGSRENHICGGVLIAPDLVLTAAHCVVSDEFVRFTTSRLRVLARARTLTETGSQPGQLVDVREYRVHPGYDQDPSDEFDGGPAASYDIAVLKLATPISGITPARLVELGDRAAWGGGAGLARGAWVAGWGVTNALYDDVDDEIADDTQSVLREVELPLLADRDCEATDSPMGESASDFDRTTMLCGFARNTDRRPDHSNRRGACFGDSGGPLLVEASGSWRVAGLVSWGPGHAGGCNRASVFTRVDAMRDWIGTAIADFDAPAPLTAPEIAGTTQVGVDALRVTWNAAVGTPARHVLLRQGTFFEVLGRDAVDEADTDDPKVRALLRRLRVLTTLGSAGADAREFTVRGIPPRRAGQRRTIGMLVEVRDAQGRSVRGPVVRVDAPVDARGPVAPAAPRVRGADRGAPILRWSPAFDADCVRWYEVTVRAAGSRTWRRVGRVDAFDCPGGMFEEEERDGYDPRRLPDVTYRHVLYQLEPGRYLTRLVASDRAGNRTLGRIGTAHVARRVTPPARICSPIPDGMLCRDRAGRLVSIEATDD